MAKYTPHDYEEKKKIQDKFNTDKYKIFSCLENKYLSPQIILDEMKTWKKLSAEQPLPLSSVMQGKIYTAHNYIKKILTEFILYNDAFNMFYKPEPGRPFINALLCQEIAMAEDTMKHYIFRYKNNLDFIFKLLSYFTIDGTITITMPALLKYGVLASISETDMSKIKIADGVFTGKVRVSLLRSNIMLDPLTYTKKEGTKFWYRNILPIYNNELETTEYNGFAYVYL